MPRNLKTPEGKRKHSLDSLKYYYRRKLKEMGVEVDPLLGLPELKLLLHEKRSEKRVAEQLGESHAPIPNEKYSEVVSDFYESRI